MEFLSGRSRPNTVLAVAYDLKVFFEVVGKPSKRVRPGDVLGFMTAQRVGQPSLSPQLQPVQEQGGGVSARTLRRRLSSVSGLFAFLHVRGDVATNPVPRGLPTRRERQRPQRGVPLVKVTRTLPRILTPGEVIFERRNGIILERCRQSSCGRIQGNAGSLKPAARYMRAPS